MFLKAFIVVVFLVTPLFAAQTAPAAAEKKSVYSEADLPAGTFADLTDEQKKVALKVINEKNCTCGCKNDTIAQCRMNDPNCATAPKLLTQAAVLARQGKDADAIWKEISAPVALAPAPSQATQITQVDYRPDDPYQGAEFAKVTIIEFSEFQCPYCKRVEPALKKLLETYGKDLKIVWKHQPLSFHNKAMSAAEAAEAAREQGKFWEMHRLLFENQQQLAQIQFETLASQIGLDVEKFKQSVAEHKNQSRILEDSRLGASIGAGGTPTFFINGRKLVGAQPFERFKPIIDEELKKAEELLKKGEKLDASFYGKMVAQNKAALGTK